LSSTSSNKQPLLIDRPLFDSVRVTTQTVGSSTANTVFVQGGQAPSILVDMDAALQEDNNSGGVIDSITITRNDFYRGADYTVNSGTSGNVISLASGQIVFVEETGVVGTAPASGYGYYTYTGATTLTGMPTPRLSTQAVLRLASCTTVLLTATSQPLPLSSTRHVARPHQSQQTVITEYCLPKHSPPIHRHGRLF
jgi:hypothetical protein